MLKKVNRAFEVYWELKGHIWSGMGLDKATVYEIWNDGNTNRIKTKILHEICLLGNKKIKTFQG